MTKPDLRLIKGGRYYEDDDPTKLSPDIVAIGLLGTAVVIMGTIVIKALRREQNGPSSKDN